MIDFLKNRATVRSYTSETIPQDILDELFQAATRASTTGNLQLYSIIVTKELEMKEKLSPLHFNQPMIKQAPVVLTFCADYNRYSKWCEINRADPGCDNFQAFFTAAIDALIVAQTFCVAAESKGLGICYLGTATYTAKAIGEVLGLPKYVVPVATVTVGYPAATPQLADRLPKVAVIHNEKYTEFTKYEISSHFSTKENLETSKKFVNENNKENLAQVFAEVRYTRDNFEKFSIEYMEAIKSQGFNF